MKYLRLFIYSIFALFLASLSVKASTEDIYSFDDLTPSKTIVNGTKLSVGDSYPTDMRIIYNEGEIALENNKKYQIGNGLNNDICYGLDYIDNGVIYLKSVPCIKIDKPTYRNGYKINYKANYNWYKVRDVVVKSNDFKYENDIYKASNGSLKLEFDANESEFIYFNLKKNILDDSSFEVYLDDIRVELRSNEYFYNREYIKIREDGKHTLEFIYNGDNNSYALIKNIYVLSFIGNDDTLNTSLLSNKEKILYEVKDTDIIDEGIIYYVNNLALDEDPFVGNNPKTVDFIYVIVAIFGAIVISLLFSVYKVNKTRRFVIDDGK